MEVNKQEWGINDADDANIYSDADILIPWLDISIGVWFNLEEGQDWCTETQTQAYEEFVNLHKQAKDVLSNKLELVYHKKVKKGKVKRVEYSDIFDTINWSNSQLCIPQLYNSENLYALLLFETKWEQTESEYSLELELLYTNGMLERIQEMTGLWLRIEWFEDYLKR